MHGRISRSSASHRASRPEIDGQNRLKEWRTELWYVQRRGATWFCLGAFQDALWLRRNDPSPVKRSLIHIESPLRCLALLAALAAVCLFIAVRLPAPRLPGMSLRLRARDLPAFCIAMLVYSCVLLPVTRLAMGWAPANRYPTTWPSRLRRGIFLTLKIALVQPSMLCGFLLMVSAGPLATLAPLGLYGSWILMFRWVLIDQRRRCPVCLRLLTDPARIGASSRTFLEWYGAESLCSRGHGLLHDPEILNSYHGAPQWLSLDSSWSLSSEAAGAPR